MDVRIVDWLQPDSKFVLTSFCKNPIALCYLVFIYCHVFVILKVDPFCFEH
jgi:hypothetical protein